MIDEELTPATSQSPPCALLDIGMLSKNGDLHSLPQHTKLELLNHTPDPKFNYPTKYVHGCNRRFKPEGSKITLGCITVHLKMVFTAKLVLCLLPLTLEGRR